MMRMRWLLALMAVLLAGNGLHMLFAPEHWYHSLQSVPHTGPLNAHFVRDIGCAYLASALGFAFAARRDEWRTPGLILALVFLGAHAGVHLWEALLGHAVAQHSGVIDAIGVYAPPLLALAVLMAVQLRRGKRQQP